LNQILTLIRS